MDSYQDCKRYEESKMVTILGLIGPDIDSRDLIIQPIQCVDEQKTHGDLRIRRKTDPEDQFKTVDVKSERRASLNMFFEIWSNFRPYPFAKPGWGMELQANKIWYHFDDAGVMASLDFRKLREWLFAPRPGENIARIHKYSQIPQTANQQKNETVGALVPFSAMPKEVFSFAWILEPGKVRRCDLPTFLERIKATIRVRSSRNGS